MKLVGCFVPSLYLCGGNVSEGSLLLLDLLADSIEVGLDLRFENVPLRFQLRLGALPSGLACLSLCFGCDLKLVAQFFFKSEIKWLAFTLTSTWTWLALASCSLRLQPFSHRHCQ
jgi:hypothetical protein